MQIAGIVLIVVGILDPLLALFVIGPRIPDESKRRILVASLLGTGLTMVTLGALLLVGMLKG